jgi:hypothetical protein
LWAPHWNAQAVSSNAERICGPLFFALPKGDAGHTHQLVHRRELLLAALRSNHRETDSPPQATSWTVPNSEKIL